MSEESPAQKIPNTDELSDRTLGDFQLLRRLGAGGMAEVYLAEQISLGRSVAVKVLRSSAITEAGSTVIKRFEQEARAAGGLSHPNIVQVYMIGEDRDLNIHYIVQEYVQGQNLNQWVKRNGPPEFLQGLKWMRDIAAALKAASDAGIVHRDVKPENIMLTRDEQAKVTDFGLAQLNEKQERMNLTQAGTTMGTPWYMSPEQIQGESLDHRSDQYSFGITCYHMFAGQPPFPGRNSMAVAVQHLKEDPTPLSELRRDLPRGLCDAIHRMLEKDPAARFESPEQVQNELDGLQNAPVNLSIADATSFSEWVVASLPSPKQLAIMLLLCTVVGAIAGRRALQPPLLRANAPEGFDQFPKQDSAAQQMALAMLSPDNPAGWKSVIKHFDNADHDEALWAQMHLGLLYLDQPDPDPQEALRTFEELLSGATGRDDIRFAALLGMAQATHGDRNAHQRIVVDRIAPKYRDRFRDEMPEVPPALRETAEQLREDFPSELGPQRAPRN